jgi:single-stranded-DNA-specific exonuclease
VAALRWRIAAHDAARIAALERAARVSPLVAQILLARRISAPEEVRAFLEPKMADLREPESLPGIPQAVERIMRSVDAGERVAVYGDYDADGMTAAAMLFACLKKLGADVRYHVPSRLDDGYGLNSGAIEKLAAKGVRLIVTVDCGINSLAEASRAKELGVSLVITDHHEPGAELPDVDAIVHPRLPGADAAVAHLCGAAVAFKLCWALCQERSKAKKVSPELRTYLL